MAFAGIGTCDENTVCITNFTDGVGHCATAKTCRQTGDGGAMSQSSAVINVVCANPCTYKFLKEVVFFVSTTG